MTRNNEDVDTSHGVAWGIWRINVTAGAWYRIVTNYDPWLPDPPSDPVSRRATVLARGSDRKHSVLTRVAAPHGGRDRA